MSGDAPAAKKQRGWISLYAVAFGLLMVSALIFEVTTIGWLQSTRPLMVSAVFSVASLLVAVASVLVPRRSR